MGAAFFTAAFLGAAFFTAAFLGAAAFFTAAFLGAAFLAAAFLGAAAFFGAAFFTAAFLGAAFFTAAFFGAAGVGAAAGGVRSAIFGSFLPLRAGVEGRAGVATLPLALLAPVGAGTSRGVGMDSLAAGAAVGASAAAAAEPVLPLGFTAFFGGSTPARIWARRLPG